MQQQKQELAAKLLQKQIEHEQSKILQKSLKGPRKPRERKVVLPPQTPTGDALSSSGNAQWSVRKHLTYDGIIDD